jgi:hypothetical protein
MSRVLLGFCVWVNRVLLESVWCVDVLVGESVTGLGSLGAMGESRGKKLF